jgi:translation initiation factor 2A
MDQKGNVTQELGTLPRNFVAFNAQGRLLCLAGFGNLAGQVDIWDLQHKKKHSSFNAPNSSQCDWSPDGRYLMCATVSPRLRVDNGVRIFHCSGELVHVEGADELYQVSVH